ncbi:MAG: hypothetical protein HY363_03010 [Candidatus Aenigmarchaeota archaeon]|nr:hypothetical protein [Candidatus Aenigmarchaeota archaeon]
MQKEQELVHFVQASKGFGAFEKIKLIIFASGEKKACFVRMKISSENMDEKAHFEKHLKECGKKFIVSRPKTFEEIIRVTKNKAVWKPAGIWYGYDLFADTRTKNMFLKYRQLKHDNNHKTADKIGAKIYGYPACCMTQYSKEHDVNYIKKNYSYYQFYKKVHAVDKKLQFIFHIPCSVECNASRRMNEEHKRTVIKLARKFYCSYSAKYVFNVDVIVDSFSDIFDDNGKSIWEKKNGCDAAFLTAKKINGKYYLLSCLTKKQLEKWAVYAASIKTQYDTAQLNLGRKKKTLKNFHHQRWFYIP